MLSSLGSFLLQNLSGRPSSCPSEPQHDTSTDGESAHAYAGDASVPANTTRLRTISTAKHLDGRMFYGRLFSIELPESNCMRIDANLTQGTSCLPPSKMVGQSAVIVEQLSLLNFCKLSGPGCVKGDFREQGH